MPPNSNKENFGQMKRGFYNLKTFYYFFIESLSVYKVSQA